MSKKLIRPTLFITENRSLIELPSYWRQLRDHCIVQAKATQDPILEIFEGDTADITAEFAYRIANVKSNTKLAKFVEKCKPSFYHMIPIPDEYLPSEEDDAEKKRKKSGEDSEEDDFRMESGPANDSDNYDLIKPPSKKKFQEAISNTNYFRPAMEPIMPAVGNNNNSRSSMEPIMPAISNNNYFRAAMEPIMPAVGNNNNSRSSMEPIMPAISNRTAIDSFSNGSGPQIVYQRPQTLHSPPNPLSPFHGLTPISPDRADDLCQSVRKLNGLLAIEVGQNNSVTPWMLSVVGSMLQQTCEMLLLQCQSVDVRTQSATSLTRSVSQFSPQSVNQSVPQFSPQSVNQSVPQFSPQSVSTRSVVQPQQESPWGVDFWEDDEKKDHIKMLINFLSRHPKFGPKDRILFAAQYVEHAFQNLPEPDAVAMKSKLATYFDAMYRTKLGNFLCGRPSVVINQVKEKHKEKLQSLSQEDRLAFLGAEVVNEVYAILITPKEGGDAGKTRKVNFWHQFPQQMTDEIRAFLLGKLTGK